jgi:uncharacterized membrane protein HdeD (DUF308 family)
MDKFSKKTSRALIIRGIFYLMAGVIAIFLNIKQGGHAIPLFSFLILLSSGVLLIATFGHKKKQQIWYYTAIWSFLELVLGLYLILVQPDYEFFINLIATFAILTALFAIVFSISAKKKQNYFYIIVIFNGVWGFAITNYYVTLLPFFNPMLIGFLIVNGILALYGGLLYQSVQGKISRKKSA